MVDPVIFICKECSDERKNKMQKNIDQKIDQIKEYLNKGKIWLKVCLTSGELNEHVWIEVTKIDTDSRMFSGKIDNDIIDVKDKYSYGDEVLMSFDEIEDIFVNNEGITDEILGNF